MFLLILIAGSAAAFNEPPKPYPEVAPVAKTITLMMGCESGKCTPVTVPVGSLLTASGGVIVPIRVENGVTIYRDHELHKGGSCPCASGGGGTCGSYACPANGGSGGCPCTTAASSCANGQCGQPASTMFRQSNYSPIAGNRVVRNSRMTQSASSCATGNCPVR